jgi:hypothetical protein
VFGLVSARAGSPTKIEDREDRKLASTTRIGTKSVPNNRKKDKQDLKIFKLEFIKQTNYREISFPAPYYAYKTRAELQDDQKVLQTKVLTMVTVVSMGSVS